MEVMLTLPTEILRWVSSFEEPGIDHATRAGICANQGNAHPENWRETDFHVD